jgi:hypothetical protein
MTTINALTAINHNNQQQNTNILTPKEHQQKCSQQEKFTPQKNVPLQAPPKMKQFEDKMGPHAQAQVKKK